VGLVFVAGAIVALLLAGGTTMLVLASRSGPAEIPAARPPPDPSRSVPVPSPTTVPTPPGAVNPAMTVTPGTNRDAGMDSAQTGDASVASSAQPGVEQAPAPVEEPAEDQTKPRETEVTAPVAHQNDSSPSSPARSKYGTKLPRSRRPTSTSYGTKL
jgi:hypothetical protein